MLEANVCVCLCVTAQGVGLVISLPTSSPADSGFRASHLDFSVIDHLIRGGKHLQHSTIGTNKKMKTAVRLSLMQEFKKRFKDETMKDQLKKRKQ